MLSYAELVENIINDKDLNPNQYHNSPNSYSSFQNICIEKQIEIFLFAYYLALSKPGNQKSKQILKIPLNGHTSDNTDPADMSRLIQTAYLLSVVNGGKNPSFFNFKLILALIGVIIAALLACFAITTLLPCFGAGVGAIIALASGGSMVAGGTTFLFTTLFVYETQLLVLLIGAEIISLYKVYDRFSNKPHVISSNLGSTPLDFAVFPSGLASDESDNSLDLRRARARLSQCSSTIFGMNLSNPSTIAGNMNPKFKV